DEDEPDQYWYYFQANGKAYKGSDSGTTTRFKTINGKKYAFDEEGKMLYGWVKDGERQTGDDDWMDAEYYLGDENDGAMKTGWQLIHILDENWDEKDETFDEDQDRWFYFKSSGKRYYNDPTSDKAFVTKTINGKKYGFDEHGRMVAEWNVATIEGSPGEASYTKQWSYFSSPEDGARKTKGWFKIIPDEELDEDKYDDCEENWYYADGKGKLIASQIKTINGRKYAFDEYGRMLDGLRLLRLDPTDKKVIMEAPADDDADRPYDTEEKFDNLVKQLMDEAYSQGGELWAMMYFGAEDDGSMKTGKQTITIDGDKFEFYFEKSGVRKGYGKSGIDTGDKVAYAMGKKYKADSDNKYEIVYNSYYKTDENGEIAETGGGLIGMSFDEFITMAGIKGEANKKGDKKVYDLSGVDLDKVYVVNTSGSVIKSKSKCKDGDDIVVQVKDWKITEMYEELD
ncbi:cell wall-binding protein, partial [Lachnospiraceae bacterium 62-35]